LIFPTTTVAKSDEEGFRYLITNGDCDLYVEPGDNVMTFLGITKYEPPLPPDMIGQCFHAEGLPNFDVEPVEKHMGAFVEGEEIVATEKIHGVCGGFSFFPDRADEFLDQTPSGVFVWSKGMASRGMAFSTGPENDSNIYVKQYRKLFEGDSGKLVWQGILSQNEPVHLIGEIVGPGVQNYSYGLKQAEFLLFDIYVGEWRKGRFLNYTEMAELATAMDILTTPLVYAGPYNWSVLIDCTLGKDTLSGTHIREGVVIRPTVEREDLMLGRVCAKLVSADFKLRKGAGNELS
jgi:RNA ligase (TIGR02306 family)